MSKFELPRGIRDIEPEEYERLNYVKEEFIRIAKIFDFKLMEPSTIEMLKTLEAKSGQSIKDEIYAFKDKGNRDIALRFDLTVGITRYVTSRRDLPIPAKYATFGSVWRYDEPQFGRYRWFHQWDVEIYDNFSIESDAEVIEFTNYFLDKLGIGEFVIKINDREMMERFIRERLNINNVEDYLRALDKLSKKSKEEILEEYSTLQKDKLKYLLDLIEEDLTIKRLNEYGFNTTNLELLLDSLKARKINNVKIDLAIVRGLDYYSGIVFEVFSKESKNAIVGGGRYNKLTEVFNRSDLGATGAAGGVERIIPLLNNRNEIKNKVFVAYSDSLRYKAIEFTSDLRKKGIITSTELGKRSLKKQLDYALKNGFNKAVIFLEQEFKEGKVIIKDLKVGKEEIVKLNTLLDDSNLLNLLNVKV